MASLSAFLSKAHARRPRLAKGKRIYAVGDVHGRHELLKRLLRKIVTHWEDCTPRPWKIDLIFLGDIIDRGPDSNRCLQVIARLVEHSGVRLLRGNHEDMMLQTAQGNPAALDAWMEHGGDATLRSYGLDKPMPNEDMTDFAQRLQDGVPELHWQLLREAPVSHREGDYLFVHAGVRPGVPIKKQVDEDLYMIRETFTDSTEWHGAVVVHGHSIVDEPTALPNRIACDTGAYRTDRLSCACIDTEKVTFLTT